MTINSVNNATAAPRTAYSAAKTKANATPATPAGTANQKVDTGVVYEKSSRQEDIVTKKADYALVDKLKADAEQRTAQLRSLVEKMMTKQGTAIGNADSMWRFLAKGDFNVDAATQTQAQKDIAEDGYWGVEQTSDRILDFAKALSGNNPEKADLFLGAFKKGFQAATKTWGDKLPDISQRTYDAVIEKFENWKKGSQVADSAQTEA